MLRKIIIVLVVAILVGTGVTVYIFHGRDVSYTNAATRVHFHYPRTFTLSDQSSNGNMWVQLRLNGDTSSETGPSLVLQTYAIDSSSTNSQQDLHVWAASNLSNYESVKWVDVTIGGRSEYQASYTISADGVTRSFVRWYIMLPDGKRVLIIEKASTDANPILDRVTDRVQKTLSF